MASKTDDDDVVYVEDELRKIAEPILETIIEMGGKVDRRLDSSGIRIISCDILDGDISFHLYGRRWRVTTSFVHDL